MAIFEDYDLIQCNFMFICQKSYMVKIAKLQRPAVSNKLYGNRPASSRRISTAWVRNTCTSRSRAMMIDFLTYMTPKVLRSPKSKKSATDLFSLQIYAFISNRMHEIRHIIFNGDFEDFQYLRSGNPRLKRKNAYSARM